MQHQAGGLAALPADVCTGIFRALASAESGIEDVKQASLASKLLRDAAALCVARLLDLDSTLPEEAWDRFPAAMGVVVRLQHVLELEAVERHLSALPPRLPPRLQHLTLQRINAYLPAACIEAFVQRLVASPCAGSLKEVVLAATVISTCAAQALLGQLPGLQRLVVCLSTEEEPEVRFSSYPPALEDLDLRCGDALFNGAAALVAAPCAATLKRFKLAAITTAPDVDVLLRGLPALEQLVLEHGW
jgi:hypothetical protein